MEECNVRKMEWDDVPAVSARIREWKGVPPGGCSPSQFLHQFGESTLVLLRGREDISGVITGTISPGYPGSAMIQILLVDGAMLGTGAVKFFVGRFCSAAKEQGCDKVIAVVPHKSHSFLSLFSLSDFAPVAPPPIIKAGEPPPKIVQGSAEAASSPAFWWKDYFGSGEHAVVMVREI